jgi:hypothetical protein
VVQAQAPDQTAVVTARAREVCVCLGETDGTMHTGSDDWEWWAAVTTARGSFVLTYHLGVGTDLELPDAAAADGLTPLSGAERAARERFAHDVVRCFYQTARDEW